LGGEDTDDAAPKKSEKTEEPEKDELPDALKLAPLKPMMISWKCPPRKLRWS
jgi:hypothetical protein